MDVTEYYRSLAGELAALKHRVRNFIQRQHWLTDGEWKESVLRSMIGRHLPDTVKIGRGFVLTKTGPTTQCDVLLYRANCPVLFRDGELVFVTPDAVLGIIEVKSTADRPVFRSALKKFRTIGRKLEVYRDKCFFGVFAYENKISDETILDELQAQCWEPSQVIDLVNLGDSTFVKWWKESPGKEIANYEHWHCYRLPSLSAGYFVSNVLGAIAPQSMKQNESFWFPDDEKELSRPLTRKFEPRSRGSSPD